MEHSFLCFLRGLFCTFLLFVFSFFSVLGVQSLIVNYKNSIEEEPEPKKEEPQKEKEKPIPKRKTIKSIEINPDEFDRIYVKRS